MLGTAHQRIAVCQKNTADTAVHAACMEEFLLETVGVEALAARARYEHRREVEMDAERGEGL